MIRITNDYVIDTDSMQYTVKIDRHKVDKKGNAIYSPVGYYTSLENALYSVCKKVERQKLQRTEYSLVEAINLVKTNNQEFKDMFSEKLNEKKTSKEGEE